MDRTNNCFVVRVAYTFESHYAAETAAKSLVNAQQHFGQVGHPVISVMYEEMVVRRRSLVVSDDGDVEDPNAPSVPARIAKAKPRRD